MAAISALSRPAPRNRLKPRARCFQGAQRGVLVAGEDPRFAVNCVPLEGDDGNPFDGEAAENGAADGFITSVAVDEFYTGAIGERSNFERGAWPPPMM